MELSSDFGETMPPFKRGLTCPCLDTGKLSMGQGVCDLSSRCTATRLSFPLRQNLIALSLNFIARLPAFRSSQQ